VKGKIKTLVTMLLAALVGVAAGAVVDYSFDNNGTIEIVGVSFTYLNGTEVTSLNWGAVENGTATLWPEPFLVTNTGNTNVTLLLYTQNHSPSIIALLLTWNYTGQVLEPGESVAVTLTQTVTATGPWSYTAVIEGKS